MSSRHLALVSALALALAACGGDDDSDDEMAAPASSAASSAAPGPAQSAEPDADPAPSGEVTTIIGTLGTPDDPEAFEIGLTDADGNEISELPAGDYLIEVDDQARIHNWHLSGPGDVDVETGVSDVEKVTFEVTLVAGEYDILCDPHPSSMSLSLTVT